MTQFASARLENFPARHIPTTRNIQVCKLGMNKAYRIRAIRNPHILFLFLVLFGRLADFEGLMFLNFLVYTSFPFSENLVIIGKIMIALF